MDRITESNQLAIQNSEIKFLENTMLNLLAANQFSKLIDSAIGNTEENITEGQLLSSLFFNDNSNSINI